MHLLVLVSVCFHLHHKDNSVERDQGHDGVFKWRRHHKLPHAVLEGLLVLGHVPCQRLSINSKVYAGSLKTEQNRTETMRFNQAENLPYHTNEINLSTENEEDWSLANKHMHLICPSPHSFPGYNPPSFCLLAPGK